MSKLILIFICMMVGILLQRVKRLPVNFHFRLNSVILYALLPALILLSIPTLTWSRSLIPVAIVAWIIFFMAYGFFSFVGARFKWDMQVIGCLILTAGFGNTSFVGFPIIEALLGTEALKYAVVLDQAGTFLICSTFGIWVALSFSQGSVPRRMILKRVVMFPPFLAFALSLILTSFEWIAFGRTKIILESLAGLLAPVALISVGLQLKVQDIKSELKFLTWGLGFKLILAPTMIFFIYRMLDVPQKIFEVVLLESAMAPMITSSILAASHGLHPKLAGLMVGFGVPLSFLTLSAWYFFL